jgi:hypothetical protein
LLPPAVPKVLETADPLIKTSKTAYDGLHDTLVVSLLCCAEAG